MNGILLQHALTYLAPRLWRLPSISPFPRQQLRYPLLLKFNPLPPGTIRVTGWIGEYGWL